MKFSNNNNNNNTVKMAADTTKQVRVDNWAVFFLQRLQLFFSKTDYCDMTLQFNGNVQLKVHKLVINACTDYFQLLEQTCLIDENTILMPADLQADVIVPIINFMYTGMLEFQLSLYEKLYKTAQTMNITILTKLLEAQKLSVNTAMKSGNNKKKQIEQQTYLSSSSSSGGNTSTATKMKAIQHIDLPAPLPGRKLPIWKRKSLPTTTTTTTTTTISSSSSSSITTTHHHHHHHHDKWSLPPDPLSLPDNTPKPTRFEWPDDELPNLPLMDTSYESVSLTSKPLLTQEEEIRGGGGGGVGGGANNTTTSTIFDDLKQLPNASHTTSSLKTKPTIKTTLDMEEMKNYIKEQKIRSGLSNTTNNDDDDDDIIDNDLDYNNSNDSNISNKRKIDDKTTVNKPVKRVRFNENIDSKTTISVTTDGKSNSKLDHNKIVAEILKKYPQLVKENKNIRLKIMSKNRNEKESEKIITTNINKQARSTARFNKSIDIGESSSTLKSDVRVGKKSKDIISTITNNDTEPWVCVRCSTPDETVEFVLYYLYRKHMTDFHNEKFDARSCKYCGHFCNKNNILYYHLYIKHGMRPPSNYNFPKCNQCPYIALTQDILNRHRLRHNINEQQCSECKLAFSSHIALTSHIQITGHTGKTNKTNFDCQYCTKRYQSSVGLFIHVRMQHRNEAMRDGIVSIDEDDDYYSDENDDDDDDDNDNIDDNEQNDEYILPEIVNTHHHSKKVNILSNVKVTPTHIQQQQQQPNQTDQQLLEPSSEAEALNNVASGIATSLGLVDIVVLNDNQQIYLQSTNDQQANFNHNQQQQQQQEEQQQENDQQTEFILPELSTTTTNRNEQSQQQQQQQVITADGVITQSMLTNNDIASTDELVMVLTDHDYGDGNQDEMNSDNSNIVVLYSHPVEGGQQEQYITSQGNIMVNSRTGMIEIRNSAPVCPSTNQQQQIVIEQQPEQSHQQHQQESHIESIEMIQREIESHTNDTTNLTIDEDKSKDDTQIDDNGEESKQIDENIDKLENDSVDVKDEQVDNDNNKTIETTIKESTTDNINNDNSNNIDNQETVDDIVEKSNDQEILVQDKEKEQKSIDDEPTIPEPQLPEITDSTIEKDDVPQLDNSTEETPIEENTTVLEQDEDKKIEEQEEEIQKDISDDLDTSKETVDNQNDDDNKTSDNDNKTNNDEISNDKAKEESGINESNSSLFSSLHDDDDDDDDDDDRTDKNQSNTATISDDDLKQSMKIAILDDWEDTDSQQSDSKDDKKTTLTTNTTTAIINSTITTTTTATTTSAVVATDETVNKLMDDWADEDEDESKKE